MHFGSVLTMDFSLRVYIYIHGMYIHLRAGSIELGPKMIDLSGVLYLNINKITLCNTN